MLRSVGWYRSLCSTQPIEYMRTQNCCLGTDDAVAYAVGLLGSAWKERLLTAQNVIEARTIFMGFYTI